MSLLAEESSVDQLDHPMLDPTADAMEHIDLRKYQVQQELFDSVPRFTQMLESEGCFHGCSIDRDRAGRWRLTVHINREQKGRAWGLLKPYGQSIELHTQKGDAVRLPLNRDLMSLDDRRSMGASGHWHVLETLIHRIPHAIAGFITSLLHR